MPVGLKDALRAAEPQAVETLVTLMRSAKREQVRLAAAQAILDRLYGRPMQPVADESSVPLEIRVVYDDETDSGGAAVLNGLSRSPEPAQEPA